MISAGGTGGGVYPALAVASALAKQAPEAGLVWIGGKGGMERDLVARSTLAGASLTATAPVPFEAISAAGVHGVGLANLPGNLLRLARGFYEALRLVRRYRPDVLFLTGGYVAVPVALAAWLQRVPILLYVPDIEPGLALRALSRLARKIVVTTEETRRFFPARTDIMVSGYPIRPELAGRVAARRVSRISGRTLAPDRDTLLVFGGSRGARTINRALADVLEELLDEVQIIHIVGELDWPEVQALREALPAAKKTHYHAFPYLHSPDMGAALGAADLVVSRAGAATLGEYPLFGLPSILVPYPHAWRYQKVNADYLTNRGAAVRVNDADMGRDLLRLIRELLADRARLGQMKAAAEALAVPDAALRIANELLAVAATAGEGTDASRPTASW